MNKEQEQFYNSLRNSGKFSKAQLDIIPEFLEWGLTSNQIELFADPSCSPKHLEQIYIGLTDGLSEDQVRIFADPNLTEEQISSIREGVYADQEVENLDSKTIDFYNSLRDSGKFDNYQLREISTGLKVGYSSDQIKIFADPKFNNKQMEAISNAFLNGLTTDQVRIFADPKFNEDQMWVILAGIYDGLSEDQVALYADPKYNVSQMHFIYYGFYNGLTTDQVALFADPSISADDMRDMYMKLEEQNAHKHEVQPERKSVRVTPPVQRKDKNR